MNKKLSILFAALLTCTMSFALKKTTTINFGSATGSCNFNKASVSYTDASSMAWAMAAGGTTSFTPNGSYNQIGSGSKPATSITLTGTAAAAMNLTSVSVKMGGFSSTAGTVTITVNGESYATGGLSGTNDTTISATTAKSLAKDQTIAISVASIAKGVKIYNITYTYEIPDVPATGISLDQSTLTLDKGATTQLTATLTPTGATTEVVWSSSNADVATVDNGKVTAVGEGTAIITATTEDGAKTAVCQVKVTIPDCMNLHTSNVTMTKGDNGSEAKVIIDNTSYDAIKLGTGSDIGTMTVTVPAGKNILYLHAAAWKNKTCTLNIAATDEVTVTPTTWSPAANSGITNATPFSFSGDVTSDYFCRVEIKGNIAGTTITLTTTSNATRCVVWGVNADTAGVKLNKAIASIQQYKRDTLKATLSPDNATTIVVWTSSDESIATVADGIVTAKALGTAKIYATAGAVADSCTVTVTAATSITVEEAVEIAKTVTDDNELAAGGMYVIRGYVTALQGTPSTDMSSYGNYSVWMADAKDGGKVFEAYRVKPIDGKTIAAVGDYAEVIGDITKYNTTYETAQGGSIQVLTSPATDVENLNTNATEVKKVLRNGQIFIIRDDKTYTTTGMEVK